MGNPSLLGLVIKGERNLTPRTVPGFLEALGLTGAARRHFELLVDLSRAKSNDERNAIFSRIRATKHFREANALGAASFDYLSDWTIPAIRELAGRPDFRFDPAWVASKLLPRVTEARARRSLQVLVDLGMLEPTDQGGAQVVDVAVVTPHEVIGLAVFNYHHAMLERSREALEAVDAELRHYGAVTVRATPEQLARLKEEVAAFQERVLELCDSDPEGERVMQLNLQLFPLSEA